MKLEILDYYALFQGGSAVSSNGRYLWKMINEDESPGAFSRRLERASYPNFQNKIINIMVDFVFWGAPKIEGAALYDIAALARETLIHSLIGGYSYILVLQAGPAVYPRFMVTCENEIILIKNKDGDYIKLDGKAGTAQTYEKDILTNTEPYTPEQLIKCQWDITGESFIRDTAQINLQIYNLQSVLDTICLHAGIFITTGASIGDVKKVVPFMHIPTAAGEAPVEFKAPPVDQITKVREEIDRRISIMAAIVGLSQEFSEDIKIETGEARKWRMLDVNAAIMSMARNVAKSINEAARVNADINGGGTLTLQLEPLLNPEGDFDKMQKLDNIISTINIDEIIKAAQREKIKIAFADFSEGEKAALLQIIDMKGGMAAIRRQELDLPMDI